MHLALRNVNFCTRDLVEKCHVLQTGSLGHHLLFHLFSCVSHQLNNFHYSKTMHPASINFVVKYWKGMAPNKNWVGLIYTMNFSYVKNENPVLCSRWPFVLIGHCRNTFSAYNIRYLYRPYHWSHTYNIIKMNTAECYCL